MSLQKEFDKTYRQIQKELEDKNIYILNEKQIVTFLEEQLMNRFSFYQQANHRVSSAQITESELKKIILKHAS